MTASNRQKFSFRVLEIVFGAFLMLSMLVLSEETESNVMPVVTDFNVASAKETDDGVEITGHMRKIRHCEFLDMAVYAKSGKHFEPVSFRFDDPVEIHSRAPVAQTWGPWTLMLHPDVKGEELAIYTTHECHALYDTNSFVHSFKIAKNDDGTLDVIQ